MAEAQIPVDLYNPGQVFACLGFLEAAEILLGDAEGGFDWRDEANVIFRLRAGTEGNPFAAVLEFLAKTEPAQWAPIGYAEELSSSGEEDYDEDSDEAEAVPPSLILSECFPAAKGDRMALPIRIGALTVSHWADGSSRESFKLYSGNRSAYGIALSMLKGVRKKANNRQSGNGKPNGVKIKGLAQLWEQDSAALIEAPFDVLTPMGGSFNFDARGAWTAIDAGYSPNDQKPKHLVMASPVVEILAALGLEHARPVISDDRQVRYAVWSTMTPPMLARAALAGRLTSLPVRHFRFTLGLSGKNKIVTFAEMEPRR